MQLQRRIDAMKNTMDSGCQQMQKFMQAKRIERDAKDVQEGKKWIDIVSKKDVNAEHVVDPLKSAQVPPRPPTPKQEDVHDVRNREREIRSLKIVSSVVYQRWIRKPL